MTLNSHSFLNYVLQILTNVPALKQTNVTQMLRVITLRDLTYVTALTDIRAMGKTVQVHPDFRSNASFTFFQGTPDY